MERISRTTMTPVKCSASQIVPAGKEGYPSDKAKEAQRRKIHRDTEKQRRQILTTRFLVSCLHYVQQLL